MEEFYRGVKILKALEEIFRKAFEDHASDIHLTVGVPPTLRVNGELVQIYEENLTKKETESYSKQVLEDRYDEYLENGELDLSCSLSGIGRFRVNVFRQRGSDTLAIRIIPSKVPVFKDLNFPGIFNDLIDAARGLVLITGPTGSGKSTTLAAMINELNNKRKAHIITLEDPIEYLYKHNKCIINQREIGKDSKSYSSALRAVLREDPDIILIGEMRDIETISIALKAAETGHLVFSTLHTIGAIKTIDRIIDVFPSEQQGQIRMQLSTVLRGIVSQQLLPTENQNGRAAALEIMINTPAIQNLIREGKSYQIQSLLQTGSKYGMRTMDMSIQELIKKGIISSETALNYAVDREMVGKILPF